MSFLDYIMELIDSIWKSFHIGPCLPFIIFFLGYFLSWRKSQLDKKKEVSAYRDMFIQWIKLAKKRTIQQSENCLELSVNLLKGEYIDAEGFASAPLMYEKLNSVNSDKIINAFVFNIESSDNEKLRTYNSLIINIDFLDKINNELKEKYNKSSQDAYILNQLFNDSFTNLDKLYLKKINEVGDDNHHKDSRYLKILGDLREQWSKSAIKSEHGISAIHIFDKLISPSIDFVKASFNNDKTNKFLFDMYDELTNMVIINRKWETYKIGHSKVFETYGNAIISSYNDLELCINYFETQTKVLPFWKIR